MKIAGIDPGSRRAGFALLEVVGSRVEIRELGVWNLVAMAPGKERSELGDRTEILHRLASEFFRRSNPHFIGLEKAVSFKNIESAHKLSEARGVIRLAAYQNLEGVGKRLLELSPTAVKRSTTGFGVSSKGGMLKALSLRFANVEKFVKESKLENEGKGIFDAFDALGVAWTTWIHYKQKLGLRSKTAVRGLGTRGEGRL